MAENHRIEIMLFAGAIELAGANRLEIDLPPGSPIEDLKARMVALRPALKDIVHASRWAVEEEFVDDNFVIERECSVAMIPPVSGG